MYLRPEGAEGTIVKGDGGNQGALSGAIRYLMSTDDGGNQGALSGAIRYLMSTDDGGNQGALSGAIRYLMSTDEYSAMMRVRYRFVKIHSTMHVNEVR